jgi:hypothetical protein
MPLDQIYSEPEATRVKRLWSLYRVIPAAVLFTPAPKLSHEPGYEWAFDRLSDCGAITAPSLHPLTVTDKGLLTRLPGLILSEKLSSIRQSVITVVINETTFYITQNCRRDNLPWHPQTNAPRGLHSVQLHTHPRLAVILGMFNADKTTPSELDDLQGCLGALVALTDPSILPVGPPVRDSPDTSIPPSAFIACQFLRTVSLIRKDSAFDKRTDWSANANSQDEKEMVVKGEFTPPDMRWRIGGDLTF